MDCCIPGSPAAVGGTLGQSVVDVALLPLQGVAAGNFNLASEPLWAPITLAAEPVAPKGPQGPSIMVSRSGLQLPVLWEIWSRRVDLRPTKIGRQSAQTV